MFGRWVIRGFAWRTAVQARRSRRRSSRRLGRLSDVVDMSGRLVPTVAMSRRCADGPIHVWRQRLLRTRANAPYNCSTIRRAQPRPESDVRPIRGTRIRGGPRSILLSLTSSVGGNVCCEPVPVSSRAKWTLVSEGARLGAEQAHQRAGSRRCGVVRSATTTRSPCSVLICALRSARGPRRAERSSRSLAGAARTVPAGLEARRRFRSPLDIALRPGRPASHGKLPAALVGTKAGLSLPAAVRDFYMRPVHAVR